MSKTTIAPKRTKPLLLTAIGRVERETGLAKDTLRVWERRYGFPKPLRDGNGERVYPPEQVEKLRVIRRLMDGGMRPGNLVNATLAQLSERFGALRVERGGRSGEPSPLLEYLPLIRAREAGVLQRQLAHDLMRLGLQRFVVDVVAPLNVGVGEAWTRGELEVYEEHLYSEQVQHVLRQALASAPRMTRAPRLLLTTLPGEQHQIGLLMAQACLAVEGAECLSLGPQTPARDIVLAAKAHRVDVVGLSFSSAIRLREARAAVVDLRKRLDRSIGIWAGGGLWSGMKEPVAGVTMIASLDVIPAVLTQWREQHSKAVYA